MNERKSTETADKITTILNDFSFDAEQVAKAISREHKTLQQTFTGLCIEWLKVCASDTYSTDGRNEASHNIAKELKAAYDHNHTETTREFFDDIVLPMV